MNVNTLTVLLLLTTMTTMNSIVFPVFLQKFFIVCEWRGNLLFTEFFWFRSWIKCNYKRNETSTIINNVDGHWIEPFGHCHHHCPLPIVIAVMWNRARECSRISIIATHRIASVLQPRLTWWPMPRVWRKGRRTHSLRMLLHSLDYSLNIMWAMHTSIHQR